ncbi:hypothetical protein B0J18DRAFT_427963 [Chaetomium sp. MPI-SDFR-AT-0129]|nr:hypothetical protein B0J18DRAFT_427963 [Chaetomium sp. MPI-SDFR-AT-0129]
MYVTSWTAPSQASLIAASSGCFVRAYSCTPLLHSWWFLCMLCCALGLIYTMRAIYVERGDGGWAGRQWER